ncbi:MAG: bacillithiol biosynthesis cysteine-adding enzyme BshC [Bacteroidetes bacterium]|nr:bacillithiol biosynthesis cysteine-adding enzyme BshC [Bacteroidota bacterium]
MKFHHVSLEKTNHFSKLFLDYINQEKNLSSFYKYSPSADSFSQAIKDISALKFNRKLLVDVITEQYAKTSNCQLPTANCQLLLDEKTFTVCTGHQLCLFTGPLYFIYKIISTINLAEALKKKYSAYNFVPVYWMASEDHDFVEVNHINLFGKKIEWNKKPGGPVGKFSTAGISEVISELKSLLDDSKNVAELIALFENAYLNHSDYASATRYLVNELFGKYGLVILDADDKRLKNEFREIIRDDMFNHTNFNLVNETIAQLKNNGYDAQVIPKEINFFLLSKKFRGWIDTAKVQSEPEEWKKKLVEETERFSPSVITRPLYQQKIFPNLAYVGGPAEISYWLEYIVMFDHHKIFFPVLIPRNFVHIDNEETSETEIFKGELQERHDNFIPFYLKHGRNLFDELKGNLNPFDFRFTILSEKE